MPGTSARPDSRPRHFALVEGLAVIVTLACVWLTAEEHVLCWPTGILGALLYLYVFYRVRLYSDVLLQCYFALTSVYGWYAWTHAGPAADAVLQVTRLSLLDIAVWAAVAAAGIVILGGAMRRYTRAALPFWDAAITVLSLIAQYLLTGKVIESWVLWIVVDALAVGVYCARRLYLTSALYALLLALAARGLITWSAKV